VPGTDQHYYTAKDETVLLKSQGKLRSSKAQASLKILEPSQWHQWSIPVQNCL